MQHLYTVLYYPNVLHVQPIFLDFFTLITFGTECSLRSSWVPNFLYPSLSSCQRWSHDSWIQVLFFRWKTKFHAHRDKLGDLRVSQQFWHFRQNFNISNIITVLSVLNLCDGLASACLDASIIMEDSRTYWPASWGFWSWGFHAQSLRCTDTHGGLRAKCPLLPILTVIWTEPTNIIENRQLQIHTLVCRGT